HAPPAADEYTSAADEHPAAHRAADAHASFAADAHAAVVGYVFHLTAAGQAKSVTYPVRLNL
ncbi:MAG: hypothetical protein AB1791_05930, partial [Chloroflexota bacterium]